MGRRRAAPVGGRGNGSAATGDSGGLAFRALLGTSKSKDPEGAAREATGSGVLRIGSWWSAVARQTERPGWDPSPLPSVLWWTPQNLLCGGAFDDLSMARKVPAQAKRG